MIIRSFVPPMGFKLNCVPPVLEEYEPEGYSIRNTTFEDEDDEDDPEAASVLEGESEEDEEDEDEDAVSDEGERRALVGIDGSCTNELRRVSFVSQRGLTIMIEAGLGSFITRSRARCRTFSHDSHIIYSPTDSPAQRPLILQPVLHTTIARRRRTGHAEIVGRGSGSPLLDQSFESVTRSVCRGEEEGY